MKKNLGGSWKNFTVTFTNRPMVGVADFPITFEKDSDNQFKVVEVASEMTSSHYVSTGGDILAGDVLRSVNDIDLHGNLVTFSFNSRNSGFMVNDLKVTLILSWSPAAPG